MSPVRFLTIVLIALVAVMGAVAVAAKLHGRDALWTQLFGAPDQGAYDFEWPTRSTSPNDALACPAGWCANANPDITTPALPLAAESLYPIARSAVLDEERTQLVAEDVPLGALRAVTRTRWLRLPATVSLRVITLSPAQSTLALYSRSQFGHTDLGMNAARLQRILDRILAAVGGVPPAG